MIRKFKSSLLDIIERTPELRTLFGKRELEIIKKQILGIRLMPSEQMRLSRDIKKKFIAIKALHGFDELDLKKGSHIKEKIDEIKNEILNSKSFSKIKRIVLYGSTASNQRTIRSDIDIAVEFDSITPKEASDFKINYNHDENIDVQVYNTLAEKIKEEIDSHGKVIWRKKT